MPTSLDRSQLQQLLAGTNDVFESLECLKMQLQNDIRLIADQQKVDRDQRERKERGKYVPFTKDFLFEFGSALFHM